MDVDTHSYVGTNMSTHSYVSYSRYKCYAHVILYYIKKRAMHVLFMNSTISVLPIFIPIIISQIILQWLLDLIMIVYTEPC